MRMLKKRYRVMSVQTGPGVEWTHRFRYTAAWRATWYEYIEAMAGLPEELRNDWIVQRRRKDS